MQVKGLLQDRRGPTGGAARPAGQTDAQSPETARLLCLPLLLQVQIKFRAQKTTFTFHNSTFTYFFNNFLDISFKMDSLIVSIILLKFMFKVLLSLQIMDGTFFWASKVPVMALKCLSPKLLMLG